MTSILRRVVAGPRAPHAEANLDLCYVTDNIIATSGPSSTYPSRAYRNPLDQLVRFLDLKHGAEWAIWEFRAEGTGYPDSEVYNRIRHFPWPDHHPPPFKLIPGIMGSMREWMKGDEAEDVSHEKTEKKQRVIVVHCKAGKGRSGSMAVSYLLSEEGWSKSDALERFTARRMRPGFGAGVSIPSQLRWIDYVERWAKNGKIYAEQAIEIVELHVWGLRDGVKLAIEGFIEEGRVIKTFHVFKNEERDDIDDRPARSQASMLGDVVSEVVRRGKAKAGSRPVSKSRNQSASRNASRSPMRSTTSPHDDTISSPVNPARASTTTSDSSSTKTPRVPGSYIESTSSLGTPSKETPPESNTSDTNTHAQSGATTPSTSAAENVIFRPSTRILLSTNDVNLAVEKRARGTYSWNVVTSVAHIWFNCFFEGGGPEQMNPSSSSFAAKKSPPTDDTFTPTANTANQPTSTSPSQPALSLQTKAPDHSGVFTTTWETMDGLKGSSRKGARAFDRIAVVWKVVTEPGDKRPSASPAPRSPGPAAEVKTAAGTAAATSENAAAPASREHRDVENEHHATSPSQPQPPHRNSIVIMQPPAGSEINEGKAADWRGKTAIREKIADASAAAPLESGKEKVKGAVEGAKPLEDGQEDSSDEEGAAGIRRGVVDGDRDDGDEGKGLASGHEHEDASKKGEASAG